MKVYRAVFSGVFISFVLSLLLCATGKAQEKALSVVVKPAMAAMPDAPDAVGSDAAVADAAVPEGQQAVSTTSVTATTPLPPNGAEDTTDGKWHIYNTGYTWLPGINGTVGLLGHNTSVHVSPGDLVSNASFAFQDAFTPSYKRIQIPIDFIWMRLNADKPISFDPRYQLHAKATISIFTPKLAVLVVDKPGLKLYGTLGLRQWHLGNTLTFNPALTTGPGLYSAANWVDFEAGARGALMFTPKAGIEILGDAGKGGANLDYQVAGMLDYQIYKFLKWELKKKVVLQAGWRYMTLHYRGGSQFIWDTSMSGVVFGATTRYR
jgi:hypothetical protein